MGKPVVGLLTAEHVPPRARRIVSRPPSPSPQASHQQWPLCSARPLRQQMLLSSSAGRQAKRAARRSAFLSGQHLSLPPPFFRRLSRTLLVRSPSSGTLPTHFFKVSAVIDQPDRILAIRPPTLLDSADLPTSPLNPSLSFKLSRSLTYACPLSQPRLRPQYAS